jgi:hypothetical protein
MKTEILPPLSASVHVKPAGWRFGLRLWLPLFLLWLILLPLLILALPLLFIASLVFRFSLWRSLRAGTGVLAATRGAQVEVDNRNTRVSVKLH